MNFTSPPVKAIFRYFPDLKNIYWKLLEPAQFTLFDKRIKLRKGDLIEMTHEDYLFTKDHKLWSKPQQITISEDMFSSSEDYPKGPRFRRGLFAKRYEPTDNCD